ncbi:MAG TPA: ABC transporter ATP-binding protein [Thermomicrobiales bacterium]|nr:ABC transporter ATP-binding protein [Thermomicrobiales bacterium]
MDRVRPTPVSYRLSSTVYRPPLVEARRLRFGYGARPVLRDLSLRVARGEFVGLIGPNGAGKSTLLRVVCGALKPAAGELDFDGAPLARLARRALARRVAVLPQSPVLPDAFTVAELVLLGRTPHLGLLQPEGRADFAAARRALVAAGCLDLAARRLGELSGGERQRAALARALAQEPELLLLDEPTAHLDLGHQQELLATLARLNREAGLTVLAVFHDLNLAAACCGRLALLHDGRVLAAGPPAAVVTPPLLKRAYGFEAQVIRHPRTGLPVVLPGGGGELMVDG